jgi:hypothetical protein
MMATIVHWRALLLPDGMTSHRKFIRGAITMRQAQANTQRGADAIRPFRVNFTDAALADLKRRIAATR